MTTTEVIVFAVTIGLGAMSPGPDFAVVVRQAVTSGRPAGLAAATGVASGVFVWAVGRAATTAAAAFRSGLLCNVLNPKTAVFFVALMPQFLSGNPAVVEVLLLSATAFAITLLWFGTVASVLGGMRRLLDRPTVRRAIDGVTGTALVLLGIRLAATRV